MGAPADHVLYIPAVLLLGLVVGWVLGGYAARQKRAERERRARE